MYDESYIKQVMDERERAYRDPVNQMMMQYKAEMADQKERKSKKTIFIFGLAIIGTATIIILMF